MYMYTNASILIYIHIYNMFPYMGLCSVSIFSLRGVHGPSALTRGSGGSMVSGARFCCPAGTGWWELTRALRVRVPKDVYGWLSKLWSPSGFPKYQVPHYTKDPRRDHDFDNHPHTQHPGVGLSSVCGWSLRCDVR